MYSTLVRYDDAGDRDLEHRVLNFLHGLNRHGLRRLSVSAKGGEVTVHGQLATFYEKQLAIHACRRVAGVLKLHEAIDVPPAESAS